MSKRNKGVEISGALKEQAKYIGLQGAEINWENVFRCRFGIRISEKPTVSDCATQDAVTALNLRKYVRRQALSKAKALAEEDAKRPPLI